MSAARITRAIELIQQLSPGSALTVFHDSWQITARFCPTGEHADGCGLLQVPGVFLANCLDRLAEAKKLELSDELRALAREIDHERTQKLAPWMYSGAASSPTRRRTHEVPQSDRHARDRNRREAAPHRTQ